MLAYCFEHMAKSSYNLLLTINLPHDKELDIEYPITKMPSFRLVYAIQDFIEEYPDATSFVFTVVKSN